MKFKRNEYIDREKLNKYVITQFNENSVQFDYTDRKEAIDKSYNVYQYPNMYEAYKIFEKNYMSNSSISSLSFILTTGCESALRISCEAIKRIEYDKNSNTMKDFSLYKENPTWGMVDVVYNQCFYDKNIKNIDFEYDKENMLFLYSKDTILDDIKCGILYRTHRLNNLFPHQNKWFNKKNLWQIVDYSYTIPQVAIKEHSDILLEHYGEESSDKCIMIGGFSKHNGCGFRLGYIVFPKEYYDYFNLYREEYISYQAFELLELSNDPSKVKQWLNSYYNILYNNNYKFNNNRKERIIYTNNYWIIEKDNSFVSDDIKKENGNKEFSVMSTDNKKIDFIRCGYHKELSIV